MQLSGHEIRPIVSCGHAGHRTDPNRLTNWPNSPFRISNWERIESAAEWFLQVTENVDVGRQSYGHPQATRPDSTLANVSAKAVLD